MQRKDRAPIDRAIDDVVATAMAFCNAFRKKQPTAALLDKLMRATRRLERRSGKR